MSSRYIEQLINTAKHQRKELMRDMEPVSTVHEGVVPFASYQLDRYRIELTVGTEFTAHNHTEYEQAKDHAKRILAAYVFGDMRGRIIKAIGHVISRDREAAIAELQTISEDLS